MGFELKQTATNGIQLWDDASGAQANIELSLTGSIARTDTAAKTLGILPANAVITSIVIYSPAASNAATTATLSLGKSGGTGTEYLNALDIKTAATGAGQVAPNGAVLGSIGAAKQTVTGIYAETGTASTSGGPWNVAIKYSVS